MFNKARDRLILKAIYKKLDASMNLKRSPILDLNACLGARKLHLLKAHGPLVESESESIFVSRIRSRVLGEAAHGIIDQ